MNNTARLLCALALAALLAACSKVNQENFAKIENGMTQEQVFDILGKPTESSGREVLGVSSTSAKWIAGDAVVTIRFVNGKVMLKQFEKPRPR